MSITKEGNALFRTTLTVSERNVRFFAVTVVAVVNAMQQDEALSVHIQTRLRRAARVNSSVT